MFACRRSGGLTFQLLLLFLEGCLFKSSLRLKCLVFECEIYMLGCARGGAMVDRRGEGGRGERADELIPVFLNKCHQKASNENVVYLRVEKINRALNGPENYSAPLICYAEK